MVVVCSVDDVSEELVKLLPAVAGQGGTYGPHEGEQEEALQVQRHLLGCKALGGASLFVSFFARCSKGGEYFVHETCVEAHHGLDEMHFRGGDEHLAVLADEVEAGVNKPIEQVIDET